ncbi:MAG TPA: ribonuclease III domain-containing protein [Thermoplasmata archaeon]|nr:ribonuclease III domain-containing protein [Thermoplasmata archaeon]
MEVLRDPDCSPKRVSERDVAMVTEESLSILEGHIEHRFTNPSLLREALIHTIESPRPGLRSNAPLAWLGDAVVKLVVSEDLYRRKGDGPEGVLTEERGKIQSHEPRAHAARFLRLDKHLENSAGKPIPDDQLVSSTALSTAYEAVVGAIYLDGADGPQAARDFVRRTLRA